MSIRKLKAFEFTCDDPECGIKVVITEDEDARGYHGTAVRVDDNGRTNSFDWFACKLTHVESAVGNAIVRGMQP